MADATAITWWKDFTTIVGIVVGVIGGLWKWIFAEQLRRRKEVPAIDGNLKSSFIETGDGFAIFTIASVWRNRGTHPVFINTSDSCFQFSAIDAESVNVKLSIDPLFEDYPLRAFSRYMLEPNTESEILSVVKLRASAAYLVTVTLYMDTGKYDGLPLGEWSFHRKIAVSASVSLPASESFPASAAPR